MPLIFASDETFLTNFSGGRVAWPIYMTVGNIHSSVRSAPSNNAWILVALLPCPPSCTSNNAAELREYQKVKSANLHTILDQILNPLVSVKDNGMYLRCADGNTRLAFPRTCAWLADYLEYTKLLNLVSKGCPVCEIATVHLGDFKESGCPSLALTDEWEDIPEEAAHAPFRDWKEYGQRCEDFAKREEQIRSQPPNRNRTLKERRALQEEIRSQKAWFKERNSKPVRSALWAVDMSLPSKRKATEDDNKETDDVDTSSLRGTLWKPDLLHTLYLGMLKHVMDWIEPFLKRHSRRDKFDDAWKTIPPYPGLLQPRKAYR